MDLKKILSQKKDDLATAERTIKRKEKLLMDDKVEINKLT